MLGLRVTARNAVAFEVSGYDDPKAREPGAYWFVTGPNGKEKAGIVHTCPCGCGLHGTLMFRDSGSQYAEWDLTGEWPKATATPSIGFKRIVGGGYHWHGFLRAGVFEEC